MAAARPCMALRANRTGIPGHSFSTVVWPSTVLGDQNITNLYSSFHCDVADCLPDSLFVWRASLFLLSEWLRRRPGRRQYVMTSYPDSGNPPISRPSADKFEIKQNSDVFYNYSPLFTYLYNLSILSCFIILYWLIFEIKRVTTIYIARCQNRCGQMLCDF